MCRERGLNTRPSDLQSDALPTELSRLVTRPGIEPGLPRPQRGVLTTILTSQTLYSLCRETIPTGSRTQNLLIRNQMR